MSLGEIAGAGIAALISGSSADAAANAAAAAQEQIEQQALNYLQNAGAQQRGAVNQILPYSQGFSQAASAAQGAAPFLAPGQGAVFGGQTFQSTPGAGTPSSPSPSASAQGGSPDYSSLLSPQSANITTPTLARSPGASMSGANTPYALGQATNAAGTTPAGSISSSPQATQRGLLSSAGPSTTTGALGKAMTAQSSPARSTMSSGSTGMQTLKAALAAGLPLQSLVGG